MTIKELCKKHINCTECPYLPICGDRPEDYNLGEDLEVTNAIIETAKALKQQPEDTISIMDLLNNLHKHFSKGFETDEWWNSTHVLQAVKDCRPELFDLNYVSSAQPKTGHCKDCKYFEYDHFENMGGIPLITAHKVCKRHGLICKTDEDGYCHLWEHKAESEG